MRTIAEHVRRGLAAGAVAGLAFGLFVALVGNPLVAYAETFEHSHGGAVVSGPIAAGASVVGGGLFGTILGVVVFGVAFYLLEPAIPGEADTKSYLLAAAGFVTVSGAPWVLLPPVAPGVEQALATDVRLTWYVVMMVTGAIACALAGYAYLRIRERHGRALGLLAATASLVLIPVVAAVGPANPVSGPIPQGLAYVFQAVTVVGQVGLWVVLASTHAWLLRRDDDPGSVDGREAGRIEPHEPLVAD